MRTLVPTDVDTQAEKRPIKQRQLWETRSNSTSPWRRAEVVNVSDEGVELQYLDMPVECDLPKTIRAKQRYMREETKLFRLVSDAPG